MNNQTQFEKFAETTGKEIDKIEDEFHMIAGEIEREWGNQLISYSMNCEPLNERGELPILVHLEYQIKGVYNALEYHYYLFKDKDNSLDFYVV
jgi:hypothetical protein